ncbi:hypothetical protein F5B20DRAFT_596288 [Whalleya microplaca]|nr:hypothetical protein F5B20DRAFT_596288 [Whalleya microplaca]
MPIISRLSESTTRLLGSPLVITTPVALVKELLENSIDAEATSIEVIVSSNTVSKIEVRDNGIGIHPDDFDALGRRGHTSKIRSFEELKFHAGKSLGFRGEALASANSLAQVTITTKTSSEPVAAVIHVLPDSGGVSKQQAASAPVGTTVSISKLFGRLPVREQVAIKDSVKTLDQMRDLLRSYAMARPQLRLSFKILQSPKQCWSYSPKRDAGVSEAALQLFGTELKANCFEKTFKVSAQNTGDNEERRSETPQECSSEGSYTFEAFIVRPDADISKVPKHRYFSVDGRPVSAKRGTMKKLSSIYTGHIAHASHKPLSTNTPKECFIRLNIECPPGSYDVNIEPSKDDVLFSGEEAILDRFTDLCKEVYGTTKAGNPSPSSQAQQHNSTPEHENESAGHRSLSPHHQPQPELQDMAFLPPTSSPCDTEALQSSPATHFHEEQVSPKPQASTIESQEPHELQSNPVITTFTPINPQVSPTRSEPISTRTTHPEDIEANTTHTHWKVDMSADLSERVSDQPKTNHPRHVETLRNSQENVDDIEDSNIRDLNPWVIAKMNAPGRKPASGNSTQEIEWANSPTTPMYQPAVTPGPPILRHIGAPPRDLDVPPSQRNLISQSNTHQSRLAVPGGPYRSPLSSPSGPASHGMNATPPPRKVKSQRRLGHLPWSPPSSAERPRNQDQHLANVECRPVSNGTKQTTISFSGAGTKRKKNQLREGNGEFDPQYVNDFIDQGAPGEDRLQQMFASARHSLNHQLSRHEDQHSRGHSRPHMGLSQPFSQLHSNRVQAEARPMTDKEPAKTTLSSGDPRAYLLRRQKSIANEGEGAGPRKLKRLKSTLLPFENIPSDDQTHSLVQILTIDINHILVCIKKGRRYDRYVMEGTLDYEGLDMSLTEGRKVEGRLKALLSTESVEVEGKETERLINLGSVLKGKDINVEV